MPAAQDLNLAQSTWSLFYLIRSLDWDIECDEESEDSCGSSAEGDNVNEEQDDDDQGSSWREDVKTPFRRT